MLIAQRTGTQYLLRFIRGEEFVAELESFCAKENISGAWIEGIGASDEAEIGTYDYERRGYAPERFFGEMEVASLIGNIALKEEKPFLHAHVTLVRPDYSAFGGHLFRLKISATAEVLLIVLPQTLERTHDEETNLFLLRPSQAPDFSAGP